MNERYSYRYAARDDAVVARAANRVLFRLRYQLIQIAATVVVVLVFGAGFFWVSVRFPTTPHLQLLAFLVGLVVATTVLGVVRQALLRTAGDAQRFEGRTVHVDVDEHGVRFAMPDVRWEIDWPGVDSVHDGRRAVMFIAGLRVYYIPRDVFATDAERRLFVSKCLENIDRRASAEDS